MVDPAKPAVCRDTGDECRSARSASILEHATEALRRHFGFGALRDFQAKAIGAWADGKDVLIALSTGAGKSACFQLPPAALALGQARDTQQCCVVISPLISLMQDR
eukprot:Skav229075  [mRNA]  locus=scaffold2781:273076:280720:- [translate_table: standard]